ncbi:MAG TPA: glycosyltransferase family 2 protein [Phenylobacterium sp.]
MHVAVCIVGFRNAPDIANCLAALGRSTHRAFEVVICENGGAQAHRELMDVLPSILAGGQTVKLVSAPDNPGYAGGVNRCMGMAPDADAWWVLNPDTVPGPEALAEMCRRLKVGDCQAVGCTVHYPDGEIESRGGAWRRWLARAVSLDHSRRVEDAVDVAALEAKVSYLNGASMLVGRAFLTATGPMREEYFLYVEEVEWCLRGLQQGMRLGLAVDARVLHLKGASTGSIQDVARRARLPVYLDERNKILVTRDRFPQCLPVAAVAAFVLLFLRFGRRGAWRQLGFGLSGWWAGVRDRRGKPAWAG